jgi:hypothetical protein
MLNQILGAADKDRLFAARLANTRCHLSGRANRFPNLLPSLLIPHLISVERLLRGVTKVCQKGREVPLDMLLVRAGEHWRIRTDALPAMCERGLSFVINGIDEDVPAIGALNAAIERDWRTKCWTNAYWSHGCASAFNPHSDNHDVLVLQLSGTKQWRCWGALDAFPTKSRAYSPDQLPKPMWSCVMQPGDILFVPRGDVHAAELRGSSSLHLTVAVRSPQVSELPSLLNTDAKDDFSRRDMPVQSDADFTAHLTWLRSLVDALDPTELLSQIDGARPPYQPNNLGILVCDGTLLASALRRNIPAERLQDGRYRITPAGWPLILAESEWMIMNLMHTVGSMTLRELTAALPEGGAPDAVNSLIQKNLLFALSPTDYGKSTWDIDYER